jgi:CBS domain
VARRLLLVEAEAHDEDARCDEAGALGDRQGRTARRRRAPHRRIRDIATELIEDDVGALPVIDAAGKLVGIISYVDALRALAA